jgi:hypothetical protein
MDSQNVHQQSEKNFLRVHQIMAVLCIKEYSSIMHYSRIR